VCAADYEPFWKNINFPNVNWMVWQIKTSGLFTK